MKILIVLTSYFPEWNGASYRMDGICRGLFELGHKIVVVAPGKEYKKEIKDHCTVYYIPYRKNIVFSYMEKLTKFNLPRFLNYYKHIKKIVRDEKIDIIHTRHPFDLWAIGYLIQKKEKIHWVTEAHKLMSLTDYQNHIRGYLSYKILLALETKFLN